MYCKMFKEEWNILKEENARLIDESSKLKEEIIIKPL